MQCRESIWKVCDDCRTFFFCRDAIGTFTDYDFIKWGKDPLNKNLTEEDYVKDKMSWMENKTKGYKHRKHP